MAPGSFNHLKGNNKTANLPPPKRGNKILLSILYDFIPKRDILAALKGKTEIIVAGGLVEEPMLKPKGKKDESWVAQKRKSYSGHLPPPRGMIKGRIFDELIPGPAPED